MGLRAMINDCSAVRLPQADLDRPGDRGAGERSPATVGGSSRPPRPIRRRATSCGGARAQARGRRAGPRLGITAPAAPASRAWSTSWSAASSPTSPTKTVAVISVDPSKRKSGGALLGDRIRMNAIDDPRVYMRSLATGSRTSRCPSTCAKRSRSAAPPGSTS